MSSFTCSTVTRAPKSRCGKSSKMPGAKWCSKARAGSTLLPTCRRISWRLWPGAMRSARSNGGTAHLSCVLPAKAEIVFRPVANGLITLSQIRELCGAEAVKQAGGYEGLGVRVAFWDLGIRDDHVDLLARPVTVLGPKYWLDTYHGTAVASILCGEGRGDPRRGASCRSAAWCLRRTRLTQSTRTAMVWSSNS